MKGLTKFKERISKRGRDQLENAKEVIICKNNAYFVAKYGNKQSRFDPDPYIAMVIYKNNRNDLVAAGELGTWRFTELKNGIRSIKRINKNIPIQVFSDLEIEKFIAVEKIKDAEFMDAVRKFNKGDRGDLIAILKEDAKEDEKLSHD